MFQNKWKLTAISLALVIVLLASCFVILYKPQAAAAKESLLLDVSIEGKAKLNVDEFSNYKVNVVGGVGELSYDWSFTPADGKARFYDNGATASLVFKNATEEPYLLEVKVYDDAGNFGVASMAVYDPPTFPNYYLGVSTAPYSYMVTVDESGSWYYAINGKTGAVDYSSTNASYVLQTVINLAPSTITSQFIIQIKGNLSITAPIFLRSYLTLTGGPNATLVNNIDGGSDFISLDGGDYYNIILKDLTFVSATIENNNAYMGLDTANYLSIINCNFIETYVYIVSTNTKIDESYFLSASSSVNLLDLKAKASTVSNSYFEGGQNGITMDGTTDSNTIMSNFFSDNVVGISVAGSNHFIGPQISEGVGTVITFPDNYYNVTIISPYHGGFILNESG